MPQRWSCRRKMQDFRSGWNDVFFPPSKSLKVLGKREYFPIYSLDKWTLLKLNTWDLGGGGFTKKEIDKCWSGYKNICFWQNRHTHGQIEISMLNFSISSQILFLIQFKKKSYSLQKLEGRALYILLWEYVNPFIYLGVGLMESRTFMLFVLILIF